MTASHAKADAQCNRYQRGNFSIGSRCRRYSHLIDLGTALGTAENSL